MRNVKIILLAILGATVTSASDNMNSEGPRRTMYGKEDYEKYIEPYLSPSDLLVSETGSSGKNIADEKPVVIANSENKKLNKMTDEKK